MLHGLQSWKKRWCVLRRSKVFEYYEDKKAKSPKGVIDLSDCKSVDTGLRMKGKSAFDVVTTNRTFYFCAPTGEEEEKWVHALCEQCEFRMEDDSEGKLSSNYAY